MNDKQRSPTVAGGSARSTNTPLMSCVRSILLVSLGILYVSAGFRSILADDPSGEAAVKPDDATTNSGIKDKDYISPKIKSEGLFLYENFDDSQQFQTKWFSSQDTKYEGKWQLDSGPDRPRADLQLLLPLKARHYAISSRLIEPFKFSDNKPLVVQYEVQFREGLDCGGAYVKLLRNSAMGDLNKLTDKTPFSIMFGPDKCGSESKLHFIVQYLNPNTHEYEEKHWKQAKSITELLTTFNDKAHHLYKLVLEPSNNFEIFLDGKSVGKGNLLEDLDPPINPPKEIVDPNDEKPADWDERPQIEDPEAKKPDDWDENAPKTIEDPDAKKPADWLDGEPEYISDPEAKKPEDWEEMDGEWEPPKIENPACAKASGCGEWKAPMIKNPSYKGKWRPSKIDNPNYKGKWSPRMIPNPGYFFDEKPFSSLDAIGGIAFELWSMADNIAFDNLVITSDPEAANLLQFLSWQDKKSEADASSPSLLTRALHYLKTYPALWLVVVLVIALPLFLFISYCCDTKRSRRADAATTETARRKKTDEPRPDDPSAEEVEEEEEEGEVTGEEDVADEDQDEDEDHGAGDKVSSRQTRQKKKRS